MEFKNRQPAHKHAALRNEMHELSRERSEVASYVAMQLGDRLKAIELYSKELINILGVMEEELLQHDELGFKRIMESIPTEFIKQDLVNLVTEAKSDAVQLGEYADASVVSLLRRKDIH